MGYLTNDEFFTKLTELFDKRKGADHGSIVLVQKRLSYDQHLPESTSDTIFPDLHPPKPMPVLVRATNAKGKERRQDKIKISTVVEPDSLSAFFDKYAEVCKSGMTSLKPRDRSKRKGKARKKKGTVVTSAP
ncbi:signal recognition particle 14kD protein [Annulohypoxylon maeteangense]|uniref:signal recognition particle 14kD protein n=1 Tax=Annulohypoxylon maeteangense TaxID=1927788 RepID=UPI0020085970|nr:signal recognition particle 14kD protein [Annulohypoxylon maeteangense]KAI0881000.1 signal recognition particle 14kD protein [Annulohypoxylon maeteangense]